MIPSPENSLVIGLSDACDLVRLIIESDDATEQRIALICNMELISRAIADAVKQSITAPTLKQLPLKYFQEFLLDLYFTIEIHSNSVNFGYIDFALFMIWIPRLDLLAGNSSLALIFLNRRHTMAFDLKERGCLGSAAQSA